MLREARKRVGIPSKSLRQWEIIRKIGDRFKLINKNYISRYIAIILLGFIAINVSGCGKKWEQFQRGEG